MQKVRARIHLGNIRHNAERFSALTKKPLCAVVKANAYGHGAEETVNALSGVADCFAVALIEEGLAIRAAACGKEVLVFTPPTTEEEVYALAVNGFSASIADLTSANLVCQFCEKHRLPLRVHIKVNTGMNRYGISGVAVGKVCKLLQATPLVQVRGVYSHLRACNTAIAEDQRALFLKALTICKRYFPSFVAHLGGTYGATLGDRYAFDMLRVGIGLYGYLPFKDERIASLLGLKKGMTVYAKTIGARKIGFGGAGYGEAEIEKGARIVVSRFGYADGFLRRQENGVDGWQKNANNLCMDASIRKSSIHKGGWLPILTDAEETAKRTGTIAYEVLCAATRRAEFIYDYDEIALCGRKSPSSKRKKENFTGIYEEMPRGK